MTFLLFVADYPNILNIHNFGSLRQKNALFGVKMSFLSFVRQIFTVGHLRLLDSTFAALYFMYLSDK